MTNLVSVICPIRNEEKYIQRCLDSILNQTVSSHQLEVLIIDGMSDDATRDIIKPYLKKFSNMRLLDNPQRKVTSAINIGIQNATGDFIIRVDGHCQIARDFVEQGVKHLTELDADCVGGPIDSINEDSAGKAIALAMSSPFGVGNAYFRTSSKEGYVDTVPFGAYRREIFDKVGMIDEELIGVDDDEFHYRIRKHGGKIYMTPKIKSTYYTRSNFPRLWKQYFGYGFWKIRVLQKHASMMKLRQFVPFAFVSSLLVTFFAGLFYTGFLAIFSIILLSYISVAVIISAKIAQKQRLKLFPLILLAFPILHFSYGIGFICGAVKFFPRWFRK